jgi:hypothetical protein
VYVSVSRWLNPTVVGSRKLQKRGYIVADNCFLGMDYVMDFDDRDSERVLDAYALLRTRGFDDFTLVETEHGFHLWVHDFMLLIDPRDDPKEREAVCLDAAKKLTKWLRSKGIKWDYAVSCDTRRVVRVPGFANKNGFICRELMLAAQGLTRTGNDVRPLPAGGTKLGVAPEIHAAGAPPNICEVNRHG